MARTKRTLAPAQRVVRCFARHLNIVHVALLQARTGDLNKLSALMQLFHRWRTDITHSRAKTANHLMGSWEELKNKNNGVVVAWVKGFGRVRNKGHVRSKCRIFLRETGIWEGEPERGRWNGISHLWSQRLNAYLYIVDMDIPKSGFVHYLKPPNVKVFNGLEICGTTKS